MIFPALILLLVGGIFAVPADAQQATGPKERCTLSDDLDIEIPYGSSTYYIGRIKEGSTISPQIEAGGVSRGGVTVKYRRLDNDSWDGGETFVGAGSNLAKAIENKWGLICLVNTINSATGWIFFVLMAVSFILMLVAAFFWVTSGTNPENQKKAGKMILAALIGIAIAILARIIPGIVIGILA